MNHNYRNIKSSKGRTIPVNFKIHNKKKSNNRFCSAKMIIDNNKKENQIYLNDFINNSSDTKRMHSSKGFLRKIDFELKQLLKNKNKNNYFTIKKSHKKEKNYDFNFHDNNYAYGYINNDIKDVKTKLFFNLKSKNKNKINQNKIDNINLFNLDSNKREKGNFLNSIINNITRKVLFLNKKNNTLSDENAMNLLSNEEFYLYDKLDNFFKDNYTIKKFSKSFLDEKDGNKYLLPLFNNKIASKYDKEEKEEKKDKNKKKDFTYYNNYNLIDEINDIDVINNSKDYQKKIIEIYSKNKSERKGKSKLKILLFPNTNKGFQLFEEKKKKIYISEENKSNIQTIYNRRKKKTYYIMNTESKPIKKNQIFRDNITSIYNKKEKNDLDNFILESTKKINTFSEFSPIKKPENIYKRTEENRKNNSLHKNRMQYLKTIINEKFNINNFNLHKKKYLINQEKEDSYEENNISKINKNKIKINKNKTLVNNKMEKKSNEDLINDESMEKKEIEKKEKSEKNIKTENSIEDNKVKKKEALKLINDKKRRYKEINKLLKVKDHYSKRNSRISINININKKEKENKGNAIMKKLIVESNKENSAEMSSSFDIENEEEKLKEIKEMTLSNNLILKKSIEMEEKKLIARIEKKKYKTVQILYQYIKSNIKEKDKEKIKKENIKELIIQPELRNAVELLKRQIDKSREFSKEKPSKIVKPTSDDEVVDLIYLELAKEIEILHNQSNSKNQKSTYIPTVHLKGKNGQEQKEKEKKEEKESEEIIKMQKEREKEKEKLKLMANEMALSNELRFHIQETSNKEVRERFQTLLSQIESYQNLNMAEYVEAIKNNYLLLKEEMNQILSDKEMEDRINGFMTNLDIERNVLESKWNYLNDRLMILDNRFHSYFGQFMNNSNTKKKQK